ISTSFVRPFVGRTLHKNGGDSGAQVSCYFFVPARKADNNPNMLAATAAPKPIAPGTLPKPIQPTADPIKSPISAPVIGLIVVSYLLDTATFVERKDRLLQVLIGYFDQNLRGLAEPFQSYLAKNEVMRSSYSKPAAVVARVWLRLSTLR
ncbi:MULTISPECIES: hypothetical protein, partial [unclassified Roseovarius]|uniref:hypothetical protein n=1 Tax=unclassified Roseovarius TaxID=2614913 RepID=UPI00273F4F34